MWPCDLAGGGLKQNRQALAGSRRLVSWIGNSIFPFGHLPVAVPNPVQHRRIIGEDLFSLIIFVTGLALRGQLHFHPVFHCDDSRIGFPIRCPLFDNFKLFAEPIHFFVDKLVRCDTRLDPSLAIR